MRYSHTISVVWHIDTAEIRLTLDHFEEAKTHSDATSLSILPMNIWPARLKLKWT